MVQILLDCETGHQTVGADFHVFLRSKSTHDCGTDNVDLVSRYTLLVEDDPTSCTVVAHWYVEQDVMGVGDG